MGTAKKGEKNPKRQIPPKILEFFWKPGLPVLGKDSSIQISAPIYIR